MPVAGGVNQRENRPPSALEEQKDVFLIPGDLLVTVLLPAMEQTLATLTGSFSFLDKTQTCISALRGIKTLLDINLSGQSLALLHQVISIYKILSANEFNADYCWCLFVCGDRVKQRVNSYL